MSSAHVIDGSANYYGCNKPYENVGSHEKVTFIKNVKFYGTVVFNCIIVMCKITVRMLLSVLCFFVPKCRKDISNKLALVTGSGNGLGRAIAIGLAQQRCHVVIADLDYEAAVKTANEIHEQYSVKTKAYKVDVANYESLEQLKKDIENDIGTVDILVNNAGILPYHSLLDGTSHLPYEQILKVNLHSHLWTTRLFLDGMIDRRYGHIVAVSSVLGKLVCPISITYSTTKHAIDGFMACLAAYLEFQKVDKFIKTTTVSPYFIGTRKDFFSQLELKMPSLDVQWTAKEIVNAIVKNKEDAIISRLPCFLRLLSWLPNRMHSIALSISFDLKRNSVFFKKIVSDAEQ